MLTRAVSRFGAALGFALGLALVACGDDDDSPSSAGSAGQGLGGSAGSAGEGVGAGNAGAAGAFAAGAGAAGAGGDILARLGATPGLTVNEVPSDQPGQRWFVLSLRQPLNHDDATAGTFEQRLVLAHRDERAPLELGTQGYAYGSDNPGETELTRAFGANLLRVEHRFFNASKPAGAEPPWGLLDTRQAATDLHRVVEALKPIYAGPWFSEGVSKGGMTALYHRRAFPDDVVATVAYVAPNSLGTDDQRYPAFLAAVGDEACRQRIVDVQRAALTRRAEIIPLLETSLGEEGYVFGVLGGSNLAFEHAVQEFRYAFWQYGGPADCDTLPDPAGEAAPLADALRDVMTGFSDFILDYYEPYYYQAATELGQYGPLEQGLEDLITFPGTYRVESYPPLGVPKVFRAESMPAVASWLSTEATRVLLIYGTLDPWTAGAFDPGASTGVRRFDAAGGNHGTKIVSLSEPDRAAALGLLETWLGLKAVQPQALLGTPAREGAPLSWQRRWLIEGPL